MAGLDPEGLVPLIYHELQEHSGSLFCSQLALSSLLRRRKDEFITSQRDTTRARNDRLERTYNEETRGHGSFLGGAALSARGLHLVRWRSKTMELDSSQPSPQWISRTDLCVFLQRAERDAQWMQFSVKIHFGREFSSENF
ncbi:hypothetical protein PAXRUDRAFT_508187 [Paxillus rubicundulus Ve08.2h10]|uniref:Unplaced genomic scaffold scaffold_353, whole genome shotgun sequence n=1 Tax=Paxillus rubicundulus Ve08.2h10 TaxID=930991 RepID=A0A0D0DVK0_9AGAM|nr:hypothetical protein PAXRUDRAFT_508187 [Paxillus rubicundulus Ve08.2h10]